MSLQLSVSARNARLDAIETAVGTSAVMKIWSGSPPANCAAADSGADRIELYTGPYAEAFASGSADAQLALFADTARAAAARGRPRVRAHHQRRQRS